ncbi:DotU/TssL family secretion system protein [Ralstonia sp. 1138]|uniref:DotU family type IV/VI secretion system protein n=1 Tax=Ralstonia sp. 1138 TaxID=3156423 RepID=UPI003392AA41
MSDHVSGINSPAHPGMRDLLRDTALLVTSLAPGGQVQDGEELRRKCRQLIAQFSDALEHRGYAPDVRHEALIAQCGLLDETALRCLPGELRAGWEQQPLQVERFNLHDAGESVIERLEARMREASPSVDLLECYATILGLGFIGRYAREGEAKRTALITTLNALLAKLRPSRELPFVTDRAGWRLVDWFYRLSPWGIAGVAGLTAVIVWFAWSMVLDVQLAHLVGVQP